MLCILLHSILSFAFAMRILIFAFVSFCHKNMWRVAPYMRLKPKCIGAQSLQMIASPRKHTHSDPFAVKRSVRFTKPRRQIANIVTCNNTSQFDSQCMWANGLTLQHKQITLSLRAPRARSLLPQNCAHPNGSSTIRNWAQFTHQNSILDYFFFNLKWIETVWRVNVEKKESKQFSIEHKTNTKRATFYSATASISHRIFLSIDVIRRYLLYFVPSVSFCARNRMRLSNRRRWSMVWRRQ